LILFPCGSKQAATRDAIRSAQLKARCPGKKRPRLTAADGREKFAAMIVADLLTGKRVSRAHISVMDQILPPELNDLEFEALRQLAAHPATGDIPSHIQSRLKDIGYAKEVLGGIVLTKDGLQRISEGK
jgi:hypothetical protein